MLIYIYEDRKEHSDYLIKLLHELSEEIHQELEMKSFDAEECFMAEFKNRVPEIVFADIEMPGMDGITLGKELQKMAPDICFVFLTAFAEYAIQGYETRAYRYLLKPAEKGEIQQIITDVLASKKQKRQLILQNAEEEKVVDIQAVRYMKAEDKYSIIYTTEGEFLDRFSLQYYEEELQSFGFFRIHRKYLINMRYHKGFAGDFVVLDNGEKLPISRRRLSTYRTCFLEMLERGELR